MSTWHIPSLRIVLAVLALGALVTQVVIVPLVADRYADRYPEIEHLASPYAVAAIVAIVGFEVAIIAAWRLLSLVKAGDVSVDSSKRWIHVIAWSIAFMAFMFAIICVHAGFVAHVGGPAILFGILAAIVLGACAFTLPNTVRRSLEEGSGRADA